MLLVFSGFHVQRWCKRWHQLSDTNHPPCIAKAGYLRILSKCIECISTILPDYRGRGQRPWCPWKYKQDSASRPFTVAFRAAESWCNNTPRGIGNASPFRMFLSMTNSSLAARLLPWMRFQSIGGSGNTWIRQLDWNIVDSMSQWSTYRDWGNKSTLAVLLGAGADNGNPRKLDSGYILYGGHQTFKSSWLSHSRCYYTIPLLQ